MCWINEGSDKKRLWEQGAELGGGGGEGGEWGGGGAAPLHQLIAGQDGMTIHKLLTLAI
jgi:hypothetical protein